MMNANRVVYTPEDGTVFAAGAVTADELRVVARDITELDVVAGDDVSVRATMDRVEVESLTDHPLVVSHAADDAPTIVVRTLFGPASRVEYDEGKRGAPARPIDE